jgi:hypothetical protein
MCVPNEVVLDAVLRLCLPADVEKVVYVAELVVGLLDVLLEPFEFKIDLKTFLAANVAIGLFVLLRGVALLSQLSKLIDDGAGEDLEDDLLCEEDVHDLCDDFEVESHVGEITGVGGKEAGPCLEALVDEHEQTGEEGFAGRAVADVIGKGGAVYEDGEDVVEDDEEGGCDKQTEPGLLDGAHDGLAQLDALHDVDQQEACEERVQDGENGEDDAIEIEKGSREDVFDLVEGETLAHFSFILQLLGVLEFIEPHEEGHFADDDVDEQQAPAAEVDH